ncbi:MAG: TolC family protein [Proteobacteria bacterium]|nr:TolC family protein [Pseudomonadota bacterium]
MIQNPWQDCLHPLLMTVLGLVLFQFPAVAADAVYERQTRDDLTDANETLASPDDRGKDAVVHFERGINGYVAYALRHNPGLRASFELWRSAVYEISGARKLPEPTISYGAFLLNVETKVGPQRHRLGLRQSFPWPTKLSAGADAASARARAAQRRFEAEILAVRARVATAYWTLWRIRKTIEIQKELLEVTRLSSKTVQSRVVLGTASLADQQQVDLFIARLDDAIATLMQNEKTASARLVATIGAPAGIRTPTVEVGPIPALPSKTDDELREAARQHPFIKAFEMDAKSSDLKATSRNAARYPNFTLGLDWIEVGDSDMPPETRPADSGRDALMFSVGVTLPLWRGTYRDGVEASRAAAAAMRSRGRAALNQNHAELEAALGLVRDSHRRVALHKGTLIPQAQTAYNSVIGAYTTGRSTVGSMLMIERNLLELKIGLINAQTDCAMGWAALEAKVGRTVEPKPGDKE